MIPLLLSAFLSLTAFSATSVLSERDLRIAHQDGARSHLGITFSHGDFGQYDFDPSPESRRTMTVHGIELNYAWFALREPVYGRLGLGLAAALLGSSNKKSEGFSKLFPAIFAIGPRLTYELQLMPAQIFVPFGYVGMERVLERHFYQNMSSSSSLSSWVYGVGLALNLNVIDSASSNRAYVDVGIKKFNLIAYYQLRRYSASQLSFEGVDKSLHAGLQFDF